MTVRLKLRAAAALTSKYIVCYSLSETAKLNNLNVYSYFTYLLTEIPKLMDDDGNVDPTKLDNLLPWSDIIQKNCPKRRL